MPRPRPPLTLHRPLYNTSLTLHDLNENMLKRSSMLFLVCVCHPCTRVLLSSLAAGQLVSVQGRHLAKASPSFKLTSYVAMPIGALKQRAPILLPSPNEPLARLYTSRSSSRCSSSPTQVSSSLSWLCPLVSVRVFVNQSASRCSLHDLAAESAGRASLSAHTGGGAWVSKRWTPWRKAPSASGQRQNQQSLMSRCPLPLDAARPRPLRWKSADHGGAAAPAGTQHGCGCQRRASAIGRDVSPAPLWPASPCTSRCSGCCHQFPSRLPMNCNSLSPATVSKLLGFVCFARAVNCTFVLRTRFAPRSCHTQHGRENQSTLHANRNEKATGHSDTAVTSPQHVNVPESFQTPQTRRSRNLRYSAREQRHLTGQNMFLFMQTMAIFFVFSHLLSTRMLPIFSYTNTANLLLLLPTHFRKELQEG